MRIQEGRGEGEGRRVRRVFVGVVCKALNSEERRPFLICYKLALLKWSY